MHFEALPKEGPREELSAQGVPGPGGTGASWAPGGQEDVSSSGPHSGPWPTLGSILENPQSPFRNPSCPGLSGRCSCPSWDQISEGQHDDIHTTPALFLTKAPAPESCCPLSSQRAGEPGGHSSKQLDLAHRGGWVRGIREWISLRKGCPKGQKGAGTQAAEAGTTRTFPVVRKQ